jgi:N-acylglucosamine 2-epimerase
MTAPTRTRVGAELEERVLPWWREHGVDHEYSGVLTGFDNYGRLLTTDKYTWSQGRWAWLCARIATDARAGLVRQDPDEWAGYAMSTARFVAAHGVLPGDVTAHLVTRSGEPVQVGEHGEVAVSVLTDLFAALGLAGASGLPDVDAAEARAWRETARRLLVHGMSRLLAHTAPSEPYPVPPEYTDLAGVMLRLHVATELHRVDGRVDTAAIAAAAAADLVAGERPMWRAEDWWEFRPDRAEDAGTLLGRHRTPGHLLETVWMLLDAAQVVPAVAELLPDWLPDLAHHALELGWDERNGGVLRYVDRDGGRPTGPHHDDRYEALVLDTWDTKLWWVQVEALLAAVRLDGTYPHSGFDAWAVRLTDYTLSTFPASDGAEWLQVRDRAGRPLDRVVALPVKDPFHIARALLLVLETQNGAR